ncbi:ATP-binding cassette domain-containing protein [Morganella morganii]
MIRVNQLSYHTGKRPLFDGLTFRQPPGTIAAILGPNGRGKTTLLRLLLSPERSPHNFPKA